MTEERWVYYLIEQTDTDRKESMKKIALLVNELFDDLSQSIVKMNKWKFYIMMNRMMNESICN